MLGHRDDIARILGAIDVFVLTSDHEGLPGVLIEAQMAGCPVVTVPVGGVGDLVDDGETGYVTDAVDHNELATKVVELLRDPELRRRLGEEGPAKSRPGSRRERAAAHSTERVEIAQPRVVQAPGEITEVT